MKKRHIVISGHRGVGKSTLIEKLLYDLEVPVRGFFTRSTPRDEKGYHSIHIFRPTDRKQNRSKINHIGDCDGKNRTINLHVFETVGVEYLREGLDDAATSVIVMDELGFMETEAMTFCETALSCFDSDRHVLASVKARPRTDFLDAVRSHPEVDVFDITVENRDELYEQLRLLIQLWNNEFHMSP
ncbi:MAG TPA: AAA family ATPase [Clostridiaceae bacterium]|nr:AAA family ATPase [Clostridiaceae bacterium]